MRTKARTIDVNLESLRGQLAGQLAIALMIASFVLVWINWPQESFPFLGAIPLIALLALGWGVWKLVAVRPALARHLLVWSVTLGLLAAMWVRADPWIPFAGLPVVFIAALLISGGGLVSAIALAAWATWLVYNGMRAYPLPELLIVLVLSVVLAWQTVKTLYTALGWTFTMQQRADHLLEVARDRQVELSNAFKSLETAHTLQRRTQRELIGARRQAEEARLMKEQFAANVSHELRTPLNIILGFSEVMHLSSEVYGEVDWPLALRRDVYQIYRSARHLSEMVDDVLDLSRFEMVGFTLERELTPIEPLLRETVEIAGDLFRGQAVQLEAAIAPGLPTLEIDRTRIRQVLLNLLSNAARFTEEGAVRVTAERVDGEVVFSVSDTGPGIPEDQLAHLFEEFYQVDRSKSRRHGGSGLGLAISKHFVEAHDGRIWVESQEGVGSTFSFALPIPGEGVPWSRLRMDNPLRSPAREVPSSILVVDPDPAVATLVDRHLEGCEVVPVGAVEDVEAQVMLHHPRAVVWNVPPGTSARWEAIPGASVPLIECSLPSQAWVADSLDVAACLNKPISSRRLLESIEHLGDVEDVLIIDDDRTFCQLIHRMLETSGRTYRLRSAYGGEDGLRALRERLPDLLLLDLIMPGVDGFQVLEEMRRDADLADVPVVLLTATSLAEDALVQHSSRVVIHRSDGLRPTEVLRYLRTAIDVLEARYDERAVPAGETAWR